MHELIPSYENTEEKAMKKIMSEKLDFAINQLDERGQFVIRFFLKSNNPLRCRQALGDALEKKGLVDYRGKNGNTRSRAQQLLNEYLKNLKKFLVGMGIDEL